MDSRLRGVLRRLREAPVPRVPQLRPSAPERRGHALGLAAAAAMLAFLAGSLSLLPRRPAPTPAAISNRISEIEVRVSGLEHAELRALIERELALLRRELELATSSPP